MSYYDLERDTEDRPMKIDHIMNLVDNLVDKECERVRVECRAEERGEALLGIWVQDKDDAIKRTKVRIWEALEKL